MTARKPEVKVRVGQIWADKYYGNKGRTVHVIEVGPTHATVEVATEAHNQWTPRGSNIGRQTRVSYGPRGLNGYRLESEPKTSPTSTDQPYNPDTATARQVVEHWLTAAIENKGGENATYWTLIQAFAGQVLRAMDREP